MDYLSIAFLNLALCFGIAWTCICRLNTEHAKRVKLMRLRYTILLTGALTCGFQPVLFNEWPGICTTVLSLTVLVATAVNFRYWSRQII